MFYKRLKNKIKNVTYLLLAIFILFSCTPTTIIIDDSNGIFSKTNAPISVKVELNEEQTEAAKNGHLCIVELSAKNGKEIPVQFENIDDEGNSEVAFLMPDGNPGIRKFKLIESKTPTKELIKAGVDSKTRQVIIDENGKKVLQYNYQTVYEKDVIRREADKSIVTTFGQVSGVYFDEYLKAHPEIKKDTTVSTSIYAIPRSDYIHPLYGLHGEMLTRDWPDVGHPHHRGIFWAWPEVEYGTERGDLYALQRVFARPTGNIKYTSGAVYTEIDAENLWMWEETPIVNEHAIIRVYHSSADKRVIDLTIKILALKDSVTIATRLTNSYGGLNLRMQSPDNQKISYFTDEVNSKPQRAWSDFYGIFKGNKSTSGLMVLQHHNNPEYPGIWKDYPDLAWVQPTFPTPETRYSLSKETPLILRFRLIIHEGGKLDKKISEENWDAYNMSETPMIEIGE